MTEDRRTAWIEHVWTSLRMFSAGTSTAQLEAAWRNHQQRRRPVAAIFGAYDAGKSSLLKRLLFEDGAKIPDDLTVSGRRETFSVDEADGLGWTYRDSPGIAGGNDEHDQKALESLDLADLLVWVLPPQLVTSNKEGFDSIATGERFAVNSEQVSASLMAVISRIDEAGIDAETNPQGFSDLCARKQAEFASLLASIGVNPPRWGIIPLSADPYQGVGNEVPDASIYAMGEGWDGVPELRATLEHAASHAEELRTLAGFRYASSVVRALSITVQNERIEREDALQTISNELERLKLWSTSLQTLRNKCASDLHRTVEDELLSASRSGTTAAAEALEKKLSAAIDRWGDQASAEFEQLAASAEQEVGQRARSPSTDRLKRLIIELSDPGTPGSKPDAGGRIRKYVGPLGRSFRESFKAYVRVDLGMSIEEAAKHVRDFQASGKLDVFKTEEVAKKASQYVKWTQAVDACGPLLSAR